MHIAIGPGFWIGDDVFVGPQVTLCNDMWPAVEKAGWDVDALRAGERWAVIVEDHVTLGAGCVVLPGVRIGKGAVVGALARVTKDVPPGMVLHPCGRLTERPADWRAQRMRWAA
jgi:acetyltransferase-like isoleucine patch superfamily enzyme